MGFVLGRFDTSREILRAAHPQPPASLCRAYMVHRALLFWLATFLRDGSLKRHRVDQGDIRCLWPAWNVNALGVAILELYLARAHHDHRLAPLGAVATQEARGVGGRRFPSADNSGSPEGQRGRSTLPSRTEILCQLSSGARHNNREYCS